MACFADHKLQGQLCATQRGIAYGSLLWSDFKGEAGILELSKSQHQLRGLSSSEGYAITSDAGLC